MPRLVALERVLDLLGRPHGPEHQLPTAVAGSIPQPCIPFPSSTTLQINYLPASSSAFGGTQLMEGCLGSTQPDPDQGWGSWGESSQRSDVSAEL